MTDLVNISLQYAVSDLLTIYNNPPNQGLTNIFQPLQDGSGKNSTMSLSLTGVNFGRSGGNTFELDGVPLTATANAINAICSNSPNFSGATSPITPPQFSADPGSGSAGQLYYNTTLNQFRGYIQGIGWKTLNYS